ncbi:MAG: hypothetical protein IT186_15490 [Acidobacteria bacterium]|nr:hypothetical protein [Acidobacteriota bacterium]
MSLTNIGSVLVGIREVERHGGVLDEPGIDRLRYLEGTPKESTRWIDTRHLMFMVSRVRTG